MCIDSTDCNEAECVNNNGIDLIPADSSFCAPANMTRDVSLIMMCLNSDETTCVIDQCKWRKGKVVADNNEIIADADLFGANFCHPPTTDDWDTNAQACLSMTSLDACNQAQCQWSTGKEFIPNNTTGFCSPAKIS